MNPTEIYQKIDPMDYITEAVGYCLRQALRTVHRTCDHLDTGNVFQPLVRPTRSYLCSGLRGNTWPTNQDDVNVEDVAKCIHRRRNRTQ